jgi:hypothetical protein
MTSGSGRTHPRSSLRCIAIISALAAALPGCAPSWPNADWSGSPNISKTQALRFAAPADCYIPRPFNPVTSEYFVEVRATRPLPESSWLYEIQYRDTTRVVSRTVYVVQWWIAEKTQLAPAPSEEEHRSCVVLVDVPQSKDGPRPYYVPDASAKWAEYEGALKISFSLYFALVVLFILGLIPARLGFEKHESLVAAGIAAITIMAVSAAGGMFFIQEPWWVFEKAQAYWRWFDALPKADGWLLPISTNGFWFLLGGPPNDTDLHPQEWAIGTIILAGGWLVAMIPAIVKGLYWIATPLPLEQIYQRALAEGRAPTEEELEFALRAALAGKRAWQINIMRRKAEAFARRLGYPTWPPVAR